MNDKAKELLIAATYFKEFLKERKEQNERIDSADYITWLYAKAMEVEQELDK